MHYHPMKSYFNIFLISHLGSIFFIIINIMLALVQRQHYLDILVAFVLYYGVPIRLWLLRLTANFFPLRLKKKKISLSTFFRPIIKIGQFLHLTAGFFWSFYSLQLTPLGSLYQQLKECSGTHCFNLIFNV